MLYDKRAVMTPIHREVAFLASSASPWSKMFSLVRLCGTYPTFTRRDAAMMNDEQRRRRQQQQQQQQASFIHRSSSPAEY